jgi:hypothetical protein
MSNPFPDGASALRWLMKNPQTSFESAEKKRIRIQAIQAYEATRVSIHPPSDRVPFHKQILMLAQEMSDDDDDDVPEDATGPVRMFQSEPRAEQLERRVQELEAALQASNRRNEELTRALAAASQESIRQLQENHQCGICFLAYNTTNRRPRSSSCGHTFCGSCWDRHEAGSANISCPNCRAVIVRPTAPNIEIEAILHLGLKRKSRSRRKVTKLQKK